MGATKEFREVLVLRQENIKARNPCGVGVGWLAPAGTRCIGLAARSRPARRLLLRGAGAQQPAHSVQRVPLPRRAGRRRRSAAAAWRVDAAGCQRGGRAADARARGRRRVARGGGHFGQQQSLQLQLAAPAQDAYLASRAEALQNVEKTIAELGTVFQQLAVMVAEQGELAIRIDENVDDVVRRGARPFPPSRTRRADARAEPSPQGAAAHVRGECEGRCLCAGEQRGECADAPAQVSEPHLVKPVPHHEGAAVPASPPALCAQGFPCKALAKRAPFAGVCGSALLPRGLRRLRRLKMGG